MLVSNVCMEHLQLGLWPGRPPVDSSGHGDKFPLKRPHVFLPQVLKGFHWALYTIQQEVKVVSKPGKKTGDFSSYEGVKQSASDK